MMVLKWAALVAQWLRILGPMQEMWVGSLVQEDPLEKEMATSPHILAWEIPLTGSLVDYSPEGLHKSPTVRVHLTIL